MPTAVYTLYNEDQSPQYYWGITAILKPC
jgi:hypothetical protein